MIDRLDDARTKFQVKDPLTGSGVCNNDADTLSEFFMPTSTRFAVAVHMLTALAVGDGAPLRSEDLAYSVNTGPVVIRGLLSRLSDAGLTRSQLGAGGGALLARPAEKIRLLDVYEAVEDTELFSLHRTPPCANCAVGGNILEAMQPTLMRARTALEDELATVTIADIAAEVARIGKFSMPLAW
jgi:Rrf2 family protein